MMDPEGYGVITHVLDERIITEFARKTEEKHVNLCQEIRVLCKNLNTKRRL